MYHPEFKIMPHEPDVLLLPLWTLLLQEVVDHDAAHAVAHLKHIVLNNFTKISSTDLHK